MREESSIEGGSGDGLEDLLIYDDIFLDYFNAFLSLPAFPQTLQYHRLTGTFQISETNEDSIVECCSPMYGATDEERERVMVWASEERLPLFLRTELFRELKLCKLLLRTLEDRSLASRGTNIRGYSRQTEEYASSLSNSADNSDIDDEDDIDDDEEYDDDDDDDETYHTQNTDADYDSFCRPGSRAASLPAKMAQFKPSEKRHRTGTTKSKATNASSSKTQPSAFASSTSSGKKSVKMREADKQKRHRVYSAPLNYAEFLRLPMYSDFDIDYSDDHDTRRPLVAFASEENPISDTDMRSIEGRQNISFQRLKELLLGSRSGMQEFISFLQSTAGIHLVDFWLDCEFYKDSIFDREEKENTSTRNRLFRDLQDKYRLRLTEEAKRQIRAAANDSSQANSLFLRTQYDILRRLRAYWVPRFVLHKEHQVSSTTTSDLQNAWLSDMRRASQVSTIFPSLSCVNSLHVYPAQSVAMVASGASWDRVRKGGRELDDRVHSAKGSRRSQAQSGSASDPNRRTLSNKLSAALTVDKIAGGPFQKFLESQPEKQLSYALQFFQEVEEYARRESRSADRLLRLGHAWNICNRYVAPGARFHIGLAGKECEDVITTIRKAKDLVKSAVFSPAQQFCFAHLESPWFRFLKEDVKKFVDSSVTHRNADSPPQTAEDFEVIVDGDRIIVQRIVVKQMSVTRQRSWDLLTDDEKAARRKKAAERRKVMERERKKAIKAAKERVKNQEREGRIRNELRSLTRSSGVTGFFSAEPTDLTFNTLGEDPRERERDRDRDRDRDRNTTRGGEESQVVEEVVNEKPPELKEMLKHKAMMTLFKKYLSDKEGKDMVNMLTLYQEIHNYTAMPGGNDKIKVQKKDAQASYIYKTFLDKSARRHVLIQSERVKQRLIVDKERPKTPCLKEVNSYLNPRLSLAFSKFWEYQSQELGIDMNALKSMSEKELLMRAGDDVGGPGPGGKAKKGKKEFAQGKCGDEFLRKKVQCISSTFLESVFPPPLQIMISNDVHQRMMRLVQRYSGGKEHTYTLFDEAQYICFKELLPFWAGFMRQWEPPKDPTFRPVTRNQKMLEKRLDMFNNMPLPKVDYSLPKVPKAATISAMTFSITEGIKWKVEDIDKNAPPDPAPAPPPPQPQQHVQIMTPN